VHQGDVSACVEDAILTPPEQEDNSNELQERNDYNNNNKYTDRRISNSMKYVMRVHPAWTGQGKGRISDLCDDCHEHPRTGKFLYI
jgi:hypothetical protein